MEPESILAIDIGGGTQDILVFDPEQPMENATKLVLPSPTVIAARRIMSVTRAGHPLFLSGRVMGGGAVVRAIRAHLSAGLPVFSLEDPALTIHDNLEKVLALGIRLVDVPPGDSVREVILGDLDPDALLDTLTRYEVTRPQITALAVQDHGFSPQASNRLTRFAQWQRFLDRGGRIETLLHDHPPNELTRWAAAVETCPGALIMDTSAAALRGAILDEFAADRLSEGLLVINAGNEHTVAFLVRGHTVWAVYEHHTGLLTPDLLAGQIRRFASGALPHEEVFSQGGHGVAYQTGVTDKQVFQTVVVTGPRRRLALGLGHMAAPYGEMMLSGCFGLVEAVQELYGQTGTGNHNGMRETR